jgi:diguanylate cyclase (GGDEF)-like protein
MFLQQEISRSERSGQPITVLLVDIDDFRHLNAAEGKDAADRCLVAIGDELRGMVRDYDLVARHKDDEFVVVLPETDADAGHETAQRLHSALSGEILPLRARFSIGVATYPAHGASVDNLLSSAHHALNRAKFSGKNAVRSCHQLAKAS